MTQIRKNIAGYNNLIQVSNMKYTIYLIRHISTGTVLYVGKTRNFKKRVYQHLSLKSNSKEWLSAVGKDNVSIEAVAEFNNETDALKYEDDLILKYDTINNGYNKNRSGLIFSENKEEYRKEHYKTDKYIEYNRNYQRERYHKNDKYREWAKEYQRKKQKEYRKTDEYRKRQREYDIERSKTYKYKSYHRDYYHSKKLGITVEEYRKLKNDQDATLEQNKKQPIQLTINF